MASLGVPPIRVLLVDDVPEIVTLVRMALRLDGGFEVVGTADRGAAALQLARSARPDVVVLDLSLPDHSAQEVLVGLQQECPAARVVIYSGAEMDEAGELAVRAAAWVQKGTDIAHLVTTLRGVAARRFEDDDVLVLPQELTSVREARRHVRERLRTWGLADLIDVAQLVISELAANAITHARTRYEVRATRSGDTVRLDVRDFGPGLPAVTPPEQALEHGRGLLLVDAMSSAWGVEPAEVGKVVWAELCADRAAAG